MTSADQTTHPTLQCGSPSDPTPEYKPGDVVEISRVGINSFEHQKAIIYSSYRELEYMRKNGKHGVISDSVVTIHKKIGEYDGKFTSYDVACEYVNEILERFSKAEIKVGDKVRVLRKPSETECDWWDDDADEEIGKVFEVSDIDTDGDFSLIDFIDTACPFCIVEKV